MPADPGTIGPMRSRKRKAVADFMYHFMVYVFVGALLVILDVRAGTADNAVLGLDWAYWVLLFWGMGVAGHAISTFFGEDPPEVPAPIDSEHTERQPSARS